MKQFKLLLSAVLVSLPFLLSGCKYSEPSTEIKVGTISGPETQLMSVAKDVAKKKYQLNIEIVPFSDYTIPNTALNDGSIDANMFQTIAYLAADMKARHLNLAIVGKTFIYPMAIYSQKISKIADTPANAVVAIPNDPSNQARALLLLESAGLINLKPGAGSLATPMDIIFNPKHLQIKPLDAAQLPRVLPDVALAVINTNYAIPAGLYPTKNGLFVEQKNSPYANIVVVRAGQAKDPKFQKLVAALHSQEVLDAANTLFKGQAIPAWDTK